MNEDHGDWYRQLFAPSIQAGILKASDLAGYRSQQVYIANARHVPPNEVAVRAAMAEFFRLLKEEKEPIVRAILGHFFFRLYSSLSRWKWQNGKISYECYASFRWIPVDRDTN